MFTKTQTLHLTSLQTASQQAEQTLQNSATQIQSVPQCDPCNRSLAHYLAMTDCGRPQLMMLVKQVQPSAYGQIDYANESPLDTAVRRGST